MDASSIIKVFMRFTTSEYFLYFSTMLRGKYGLPPNLNRECIVEPPINSAAIPVGATTAYSLPKLFFI